MSSLLSVENLTVRYGSVEALRGVDFVAEASGVTAILGANGAGKSSLLHAIMGMAPCPEGTVVFDGTDITRRSTYHRVRAGVALVPEGRRMLGSMTVTENLFIAAEGGGVRAGDRPAQLERVFERFPRLRERSNQLAGTLSGGEQQMLSIGRALASMPKVILMDEPSLGLAPLIIRELAKLISELGQEIPIVLVEQNSWLAFTVAQTAYVLQTGRVVAQGPSEELRASDAVRRAYLGGTENG
jgi:branched-chain amino acid transport system ATP-binding protein